MRKERDAVTTGLVTVLFCIFAYKNVGGIRDITMHRFAVVEALKGQAAAGDPITGRVASLIEPTMVPPPWEEGRNTHVISDVLTVAAVWAMEMRRRRLAAIQA